MTTRHTNKGRARSFAGSARVRRSSVSGFSSAERAAAPTVNEQVTDAELELYIFGERVIAAQVGMLRRNSVLLAEARQLLASGTGDVASAEERAGRQILDYAERFRIMREHRELLVVVAEASRAVRQ